MVKNELSNLKRPTAPKVYRPQPVPKVLQTKSSSSPHSSQATRWPSAPPVYRPEQKRIAPPVVSTVFRPQPLPRVLQTKSAFPQRLPIGLAKVVQAKAARIGSGVIQLVSEPRKKQLRTTIATQQGIVTAKKVTIQSYTDAVYHHRNIHRGLTHSQLSALIDALVESKRARDKVIGAYTELGEPDPGDHGERIEIEENLLGQAVTDRATLKKHPATAWQDDPDDKTRQFRMSEHYDRDEPTRQFRTKPGLKPKSVSGSKNIFDALGDA